MKHILIVDDDASTSVSLTRALQDAGYFVTLASSRSEVIRQLATASPDMVLLNLDRPGQEGWKTHELIKTLQPSQHAILFTAQPVGSPTDAKRAERSPPMKPLDLPLLLQTIHKIMVSSVNERAPQPDETPDGDALDAAVQETFQEQRLRFYRTALRKSSRPWSEASRNASLV